MEHKTLNGINYSKKELAAMYNCNRNALSRIICETPGLIGELKNAGFNPLKPRKRLTRKMVVQIFKKLGAPEGYEKYEE